MKPEPKIYRGRLAPSPTGYLHLGHARTFWIAMQRVAQHSGVLILRNEDLDRARCRAEYVSAIVEDLHWIGIDWQEGVGREGRFGPYSQSERLPVYRDAFERLRAGGHVYPCTCSRQDVLAALEAPHAGEDEPVYPGTCRKRKVETGQGGVGHLRINWRFRVPDGEAIRFDDRNLGPQSFVAGKDFGDFVLWRHDDIPAYQLAVVVDDAAMQVTEVVRGADLLKSTARQILLYRALGLVIPAFFHCPLMTDESGQRLAKRHDSLSLRALRARGTHPEDLRQGWVIPGAAEVPVSPQTGPRRTALRQTAADHPAVRPRR